MIGPDDRETPDISARSDWLMRVPSWYGAAFIARPWRFVLLSLILITLVAAGMAQLEFSSDNRAFFGDDNPDVARLQAMAESFAGAGTLSLMIRVTDGDMFTAERLQRLEEMRLAAADLPGILRSDAFDQPCSRDVARGCAGDRPVDWGMQKTSNPAQLSDIAR